MINYFGGKQSNMRDTVMLGEDGFLVPYDRILATGNTHHMWWDPALPDSQLTGPLWVYDMEKAEHCHDMFTGKNKPRKLNKNEVVDLLHISGVVSKERKAEFFGKAKKNDIAV